MAYIGKQPAPAALTSSDITDGIISVAKLTSALDLSSNTVTLPSGVGGKVLQVISTTTDGSFNTSATSFTDITGMSVSITPSATSSKIFISGHMHGGGNDDTRFTAFKLLRDSTSVDEGNKGASNGTNAFASLGGESGASREQANENMAFNYLDSPSTTSAITYKLQVNPNPIGSGRIFYLNRPHNLADNNRVWTVSTITVMEIA